MNSFFLKDEYLLFKYLWLIVILPKEVQFLLLSGIFILNIKKVKKLDLISIFLLLYASTHIISIFINYNIRNYDTKRVLAAINTSLIWVIAALAYLYYKNNKVNINYIFKCCYINIIILSGLSIISYILYNYLNMSSFTLLKSTLYAMDWFNNEPKLRFVGFFEYSNLVVLFYMIFFPFCLTYMLENKSRKHLILMILITSIPVFLALSRSGYVVVFAASILTVSIFLTKNVDNRLIIFFLSIIGSLLVIYIFYHNMIPNIIDFIFEIVNGREGSTDTRSYLYENSIKITTELSPIIGMGIKSISNAGYPLGSHSTYIGLYYKAGIIGVIFGGIGIIICNLKILFSKIRYPKYVIIKIYILMLPFMMIFEDIDGDNWLIVCYFAIVGIILNINNFKEKEI